MSSRREINTDVTNVAGFTALQWLLCQCTHISDVYFMMMALLLDQPVRDLPPDVKVRCANLSSIVRLLLLLNLFKDVAFDVNCLN